MDEFDQIRTLLPKQAPPSPGVIAQARARLIDGPVGRGSMTVRRRRRVVVRTITVAAAVSAVAAGTVGLWPDNQAPGQGAQVVQNPDSAESSSARDVLLAAASKAAAAPQQTGRYWRVRTLSGWEHPRKFGTAPDTYSLERRVVTEYWIARDGTDWAGRRDIGARPATPADTEVWRRTGSPRTWDFGPDSELGGKNHVLSAEPDEGHVLQLRLDERVFLGGMSAKDLRNLPADVTALKSALLSRKATVRNEILPEVLLRESAVQLLTAPVTSDVRSAAFRLLAGMDGAENRGAVTDQLGRKGTGITVAIGDSAKTVYELVVDPASGQLLSTSIRAELGGKVVKKSYTATLSAGWTDDAPTVPGTQVP